WDDIVGHNLDDPGRLVLHVQRGSESYTVTIVGRGLDTELKAGIKRKRVDWIAELDELAAAAVAKADPTEPVVTGIHIVKGSVSREGEGRAEGERQVANRREKHGRGATRPSGDRLDGVRPGPDAVEDVLQLLHHFRVGDVLLGDGEHERPMPGGP